jgi:hypothetical protein
MTEAPEAVLSDVARHLRDRRVAFALVGGLAVSIRGEVRFTRDVDLAVAVPTDAEMESLLRDLAAVGYRPIAIVEHEAHRRLATDLFYRRTWCRLRRHSGATRRRSRVPAATGT